MARGVQTSAGGLPSPLGIARQNGTLPETVIKYTMEKAMNSVPTVGIPSIETQAAELLEQHGGIQANAIEAAVRIEVDDSWRQKLSDFLIEQVPVVGVSTILLRDLWRNIRRCALVARLYGHDTQSPETQAMILACLMPVAGGGGTNATGNGDAPPTEDTDALATRMDQGGRLVAVSVSKALATETFMRTTGLKNVWLAMRVVEAASRLIAMRGATITSKAGDALSDRKNTPDLTTQAKQSSDGREKEQDESEQANPVKVALVLFRPPSVDEKPAVLIVMVALWLLPILVSAIRFIASRMVPFLQKRVQLELPLAAVVVATLFSQALGVAFLRWVRRHRVHFVRMPVTLVFVVYAAIPGITIFMATRSVLQGFSEAYFFALLGVFNFGSGFLRWTEDLRDDAALEKKPEPRIVSAQPQVRKAREVLWVVLLLDFVIEEFLGRVCRLHSLHLLGPPAGDDRLSLTEYRTAAFAMGLVAAWAQTRVLELLQRRSVLLRLLGAQQVILVGYALLVMASTAVTQYSGTIKFLRDSSPSPRWCCRVLWIRQFGACAGLVVPLVMHILLLPSLEGCLSSQNLVLICFVVGALISHLCCDSLFSIWYERREHLESDYRVLHLIPHNTARGRRLASNTIMRAKKVCVEATTNKAVEKVSRELVRIAADRLVGVRGLAA